MQSKMCHTVLSINTDLICRQHKTNINYQNKSPVYMYMSNTGQQCS